MTVQWFPGHMHATRKALAARLPEIDVVIELLDARLPGASSNPLLAELAAGKPALKILNKQDLADPARTAAWLAHFNAVPGTRAIALDAGMAGPAQQLLPAARALAPLRGGMAKPLRLLVCGVPNVGKSTLVNSLVGRKLAKTGDEAGVTKNEHRLAAAQDVVLYDTPGMLWPRIAAPESGDHLAASGAVGRNAYDDESVALSLLGRLRGPYADKLAERCGLPDGAAAAALSDDALLEAFGRRRGCLMPGGRVSLQRAAELAIGDFRSGALGRVTLETPAEHAQWLADAAQRDAEREARRAARLAARKPQRGAG